MDWSISFNLSRFLAVTVAGALWMAGGWFAFGEDRGGVDFVEPLSVAMADIDGAERRPFILGDQKASVLIFVTHDCPIANAFAPEIHRIVRHYKPALVKFVLVYSDPDLTDSDIRRHMADYGHRDCAAIHDPGRILADATGAEVTPEAVVIGNQGSIEYRGRINDLYAGFGKRRRAATTDDLRNALDAVLAGKPVSTPRTKAIGCYLPRTLSSENP